MENTPTDVCIVMADEDRRRHIIVVASEFTPIGTGVHLKVVAPDISAISFRGVLDITSISSMLKGHDVPSALRAFRHATLDDSGLFFIDEDDFQAMKLI